MKQVLPGKTRVQYKKDPLAPVTVLYKRSKLIFACNWAITGLWVRRTAQDWTRCKFICDYVMTGLIFTPNVFQQNISSRVFKLRWTVRSCLACWPCWPFRWNLAHWFQTTLYTRQERKMRHSPTQDTSHKSRCSTITTLSHDFKYHSNCLCTGYPDGQRWPTDSTQLWRYHRHTASPELWEVSPTIAMECSVV